MITINDNLSKPHQDTLANFSYSAKFGASHQQHITANRDSYLSQIQSIIDSKKLNTTHSAKVARCAGFVRLGSITRCHSKNEKSIEKIAKNTAISTQQNRQNNRKNIYKLKATAGNLLPAHRVCSCGKCRVDIEKNVQLEIASGGGDSKAKFKNLFRCGDIWVCPHCGQQVLARRGGEVSRAVEAWTEKENKALFMLTLTHRHTQGDELKPKLKLMSKARKHLFSDREMQEIWGMAKKKGHIIGLEVTNGFNGWHPHNHILIFSELSKEEFASDIVSVIPDVKAGAGFYKLVTPSLEKRLIKKGRDCEIEFITIEKFIKQSWLKICKKVGLGVPTLENGAKLDNAESAKLYLTKFKTAHELTNSQDKKGKMFSRNQWQILADAEKGCKKSQKLFIEYANAFKGQRQLHWSRDLKKWFGIFDLSDDELLLDEENQAETEQTKIEIIDIEQEKWRVITRYHLQADLLTLAENIGANAVRQFLSSIEPPPPVAIDWENTMDVRRGGEIVQVPILKRAVAPCEIGAGFDVGEKVVTTHSSDDFCSE